MHNIKELILWQKSIDLAKIIYELSADLPSNEKYGLNSQIKRSSISIPSNIAEGAGRESNKEFKHFLSIANGSAFELQTQLILAKELHLLKIEKFELAMNLLDEIIRMNFTLQKKFKAIKGNVSI